MCLLSKSYHPPTHLVHRMAISFKFKTVLICKANSMKYKYTIYIYIYILKDHIHHIPYSIFILSKSRLNNIYNKTNPPNPLKRKKILETHS